MAYDPRIVARTQISESWSALTRADIDLESAVTWDRDLLREPRVLVPIDVQAYVVAGGDAAESMLRADPTALLCDRTACERCAEAREMIRL